VTGASAAMIALTSIALVYLTRHPLVLSATAPLHVWPMIAASSCATLIVMSLLHAELKNLYGLLFDREEQARKDARRDSLTDLGNRKLLIEELDARLSPYAANKLSALLLVDLNNFKRVNDTMGHSAGDQLLVAVAARIRATLPATVIARLGGDEFTVITEMADPKELPKICETLADSLKCPFQIGDDDLFIGGSIGAAFFEQGLDASKLIRRADVAMYRAKSSSSGYQIFDAPMIAEVERRAELANALHKCVKGSQGFGTVFQAIVSPDKDMRGLEALLRWRHEVFGAISPLEIISVAEETHLLNEIGLIMAGQACHAATALPQTPISVNVKAIQLLTPKFADKLVQIATRNGIPAGQLQLEIPERDFVERGEEIAPVLSMLCDAGIHIAVDDFGSSISSLARLKKFGVTIVKLDPGILQNAHEAGSIAIMRAKISLAKAFSMTVVCKGVDNYLDEQAAIQAGCDLLQGFRYSQPSPLGAFLSQYSTREYSLHAIG